MTNRLRGAGWAMVAALIGVAACRHEAERRAPTPLDRATLGVITGEVRFEGTPLRAPSRCRVRRTAPRSIPVVASAPVTCWCRTAGSQNAIVHQGRSRRPRVRRARDAGRHRPTGCIYDRTSRRADVPADQFRNSDGFPHNVHGEAGRSSSWNFSMAVSRGRRAPLDVTPHQPVIPVEVRCDVHPWMQRLPGRLRSPLLRGDRRRRSLHAARRAPGYVHPRGVARALRHEDRHRHARAERDEDSASRSAPADRGAEHRRDAARGYRAPARSPSPRRRGRHAGTPSPTRSRP